MIFSIIFGLIWFFGLLSLYKISLNLFHIFIIPIIFSLTTVYGIQIIYKFKNNIKHGISDNSSIKDMFIMICFIVLSSLPLLLIGNFELNNVIKSLIMGLGCILLAQITIIPSLLFENKIYSHTFLCPYFAFF